MVLAHRAPLQRPGRALLWSVAGFGVATIGFGISDGAVFDTLSFPPRGTSAAIILAPGYSDAGSWMASLRATDGVNSDTKSFLISVANRARVWPARAFLENRDETIPLAAAAKPSFDASRR